MKKIPIAAAERIAKEYGYDQVVIIARKVGVEPSGTTPATIGGEHITSYGRNKQHCVSAAKQVAALKRFMGWPQK